ELALGNSQLKAIHVNDDKVFAYASDNRCFWINRSSGLVASIASIGKPQDTAYEPVTLADRVVFPATNQLSVFDRNGKLMHKIPLRYGLSSGVVGEGQVVFFGEDHPSNGRVAAIDTKGPQYNVQPAVPALPRWELMAFGQISANPAIYQGLVFIDSRDGNVYAARRETRNALWPGLDKVFFQTGGPIPAHSATAKDGVYAAAA